MASQVWLRRKQALSPLKGGNGICRTAPTHTTFALLSLTLL